MTTVTETTVRVLSATELACVHGGARLATVRVNGHSTGVVDVDQLEWDIFTGRIPVTYK